MRSLKTWFVLLVLFFGARVPLVRAQDKQAAQKRADSAPAATKEEVEQLRKELAAQRQTIEQLKALVEQLAEVRSRIPGTESAHLVDASLKLPAAEAEPEAVIEPYQKQAPAKGAPPVTAGWNGEHFFVASSDGKFQIQPYGYVQSDYRSYRGDGAPANTFAVRRGRFGFQGNYGSRFQFGILFDAASGAGSTIRDVYLNVKYNDALQIQAGQFKEPFAQEQVTGITNIDYVERGLQSLLYPSAASAFRSPGFVIHGDLDGGVAQYWVGAFNGKGFASNNTTSVPETVGRVRFYPWRKQKDSKLQGFAFGGAIAFSKARGLSNELTPNVTEPDFAYTFFPQFIANGNVWRYEGEFTYLKGRWGFRDEYVSAFFDRTGVGTLQFGGLGFGDLPVVRFKAWDSSVTYLLTGERRPENGAPRVRHPLFGPETPGSKGTGWGAWELGFRYSAIQGIEPGITFNNVFTPQTVPGFDQRTDEFSVGLNWYINYWVRFQSTFSIDRLRQPSTIGATKQNYYVWEQRLQYRF